VSRKAASGARWSSVSNACQSGSDDQGNGPEELPERHRCGAAQDDEGPRLGCFPEVMQFSSMPPVRGSWRPVAVPTARLERDRVADELVAEAAVQRHRDPGGGRADQAACVLSRRAAEAVSVMGAPVSAARRSS